MHWQYSPSLLLLIISAAVTAALALFAWQRRSVRGATPFALLMSAAAIWSLTYTLELGSPSLAAKVFWTQAEITASSLIPITVLVFVLQYTGRERWLTRRNLALLAAEPLITVLLVWTNELHELLWSDVEILVSGPFTVLGASFGLWIVLDIIYGYALLMLSVILLVLEFARASRLYRMQIGSVLLGILMPLTADLISISVVNPYPGLQWGPFALVLTGVTMAWGVFRFQLLDVVPAARDAVIEGMVDGVLVLDTTNRVVDLNPAAERVLGRTAAQVVGQPSAEAFSIWPDLANRHLDGSQLRAEIVRDDGGMRRYFDLSISPLSHQDGSPAGRLVVLRDITDLKQVEETLALARDQALEASRLKTELLANVGHDLRTPLNAIVGYADMMLSGVKGSLSEEHTRATERIVSNAWQLSNLITDMLDQAALETGKLQARDASMIPAELVAEVVSMMRAQAQARGLRLIGEVDGDVPDTLRGDSKRIRQVLVNLVSNAIKFTNQGAVQVRVFRPNAEEWALQVSDTGIGIPEEARGYIFEPFRQVDGSPTREQGGIGLGLSLVGRLVTLMKGRIELESRVGHGSTFTIILPLVPIEEEA